VDRSRIARWRLDMRLRRESPASDMAIVDGLRALRDLAATGRAQRPALVLAHDRRDLAGPRHYLPLSFFFEVFFTG
jgi:hypothetical protein